MFTNMSNVPEDFKYSDTHQWIFLGDDGTALIGITDHAQANLGDILFLELPLDDTILKKGQPFGMIESVDEVLDLFAPLSGKVLEVNPDLDANPELINDDPYQLGWVIRLELTNPNEVAQLLNARDYKKLC